MLTTISAQLDVDYILTPFGLAFNDASSTLTNIVSPRRRCRLGHVVVAGGFGPEMPEIVPRRQCGSAQNVVAAKVNQPDNVVAIK